MIRRFMRWLGYRQCVRCGRYSDSWVDGYLIAPHGLHCIRCFIDRDPSPLATHIQPSRMVIWSGVDPVRPLGVPRDRDGAA